MLVAVGSENPIKTQAVEQALARLFPGVRIRVQGVSVPQGPPPFTDQAILQGARRRAAHALQRVPQAAFGVGIEAGVHPATDGSWWMVAWVVVEHVQGEGNASRAGAFRLPPHLARQLARGQPLHQALQAADPRTEAQRRAHGLVGVLSQGALTRKDLYTQAVILAFLPWVGRIPAHAGPGE